MIITVGSEPMVCRCLPFENRGCSEPLKCCWLGLNSPGVRAWTKDAGTAAERPEREPKERRYFADALGISNYEVIPACG